MNNHPYTLYGQVLATSQEMSEFISSGHPFTHSKNIVDCLASPVPTQQGGSSEKVDVHATVVNALFATAQVGHPNLGSWFSLLSLEPFQGYVKGMALEESITFLESATDRQQQLARTMILINVFPEEFQKDSAPNKLGSPGLSMLRMLIRKKVPNLEQFYREEFAL